MLAVVYAGYLTGVLLGAALHALTKRPLLFSLALLGMALAGDRWSVRGQKQD